MRASQVVSLVAILVAVLVAWAWEREQRPPVSVAEMSPLPTTTATTRSPTTTTTTYVPRVASPFSGDELDFLNALAVTGTIDHLDLVTRNTRFSEDGIDYNGDGRVDRGWHRLDVLEVYLDRVYYAHFLCDRDTEERWIRDAEGESDRTWREQYVVVVRAWLC